MKAAVLFFVNTFYVFVSFYENYRALVQQAELDLVAVCVPQVVQNNISEVSANIPVEIVHSVGVGC